MLDILRKGAQSWGIKILFAIIIAVFVLAFGMNRVQNDHTTVVATVNDAPILFKPFQERLQRSLELARSQNPNLTAEMLAQMGFKRQILEQMVVEELMMQQAASLGLNVSKEELAREIHLIPAFQSEGKTFDPNAYQAVLRANNLTPGKFESEYMRGMIMDKLRTYVGIPGRLDDGQARDFYAYGRSTTVASYLMYPSENYQDQVKVTDERINEYYEARKANYGIPARARIDYLLLTPATLADVSSVSDEEAEKYYAEHKESFKVEEQVRARHLLVRVDEDAPQADVEKALQTIKAAQAELKVGKTFAEVAAKYTEDPSGTQTGGELGWFGRGRMVKPFEDAAFALEKGAVSEPVRTQFGFHLISVEDSKAAGYEDFQSVKSDIAEIIAQDRAAEILQDRLDQALEMVLVGEKLDSVATTIGLKLTVKTSDYFTKAQGPRELAGLSPENVQMLFDLPLDLTTQSPLPIADGYLLATKREQVDESVKPLEAVMTEIVAAITREEALKMAKAAADKDLGLLLKGEALANAILKETEPFGRQGAIGGLGMNQLLAAKAFEVQPDTWLPEAYAFPEGYALVKAGKITPPTDEQWAAEKELWLSTLNQRAEEQTIQAFVADLRAKADVRITNPAALEN
ncbi:MAG: SurA N-terminal domain-containing protein [Desulfomicrobium apsheronum]|nr:SurA N-terminal domain-containing protein [Desulfomicrobium apsheronum]